MVKVCFSTEEQQHSADDDGGAGDGAEVSVCQRLSF